MKLISQRLLTALLVALTAAMGLTSCAELDNPVDPNPLAGQIAGTWWAEYDATGTATPDSPSPVQPDQLDYSRCIDVYEFNASGRGTWKRFFLAENESEPQVVWGDMTLGDFIYTSTADGTISIRLDWDENALYPSTWTVRFADGAVQIGEGNPVTLQKATEQWAALFSAWSRKLVPAASAEYFNPNDSDFNYQTWREQEAIYIYDGVGTKLDATGHKGYSLVNLPWYTVSAVQSNLPMRFCDNLTPENGWDLVLNYCGNSELVNNNYFAVYNKWTGILRFFTYVPQLFTSGDDHLWEVTVTSLLSRQGLNYGVPIDATIVNPQAIGMSAISSARYVSPWVESRASDGKLSLNAGWWAFDIDLSQYNPDLDLSTEQIRLQCRSWNEQGATFYSTMTADISGTLNAQVKQAVGASSSGLSTTSSGIQAVFGLAAGVTFGASGMYSQMFSSLGSVVSHLFSLGGGKSPAAGKSTIEGKLDLDLNGNIDTQGIINSSATVTGIVSPTFPFSKFDTQNTQVGRGVWNLKTAPVVWLTNASAAMANNFIEDFWRSYNPDMVNDGYCPGLASFYFFDPSSVEVELNPSVFPAADIEWTQVDAFCVSRADNGITGTDNYRKALGLSDRWYFDDPRHYPEWDTYEDAYIPGEDGDNIYGTFESLAFIHDFPYYQDDKLGLDYPAVICTPKNDGGTEGQGFYDAVVGRGTAGGMAIEPMVLTDQGNDKEHFVRTPALEVMVILQVKLRSMDEPLIYVRHYLPEIKKLNMRSAYRTQRDEVYQNMEKHRPTGDGINRTSPIYDYELKRIGEIFKYLDENNSDQ